MLGWRIDLATSGILTGLFGAAHLLIGGTPIVLAGASLLAYAAQVARDQRRPLRPRRPRSTVGR